MNKIVLPKKEDHYNQRKKTAIISFILEGLGQNLLAFKI